MASLDLDALGSTAARRHAAEHVEQAAVEGIEDRRPSISSLSLPSPTKVETRPRSNSTPTFSSSTPTRPSRQVITSVANNPPTNPTAPMTTNSVILLPAPPNPANVINTPVTPRSPYSFTPFFPPQHAIMQFPHPAAPAVAIYVPLWSTQPPTSGPGRLYRQHQRQHAGPVKRWAWRNRGALCCMFIILVVICVGGLVMTIIVLSLEHAGVLNKKILDGEDDGTETGAGMMEGNGVGLWSSSR